MKKTLAALLLAVATTAHASERLTDIENAFVLATAASALVVGFCDAKAVKDGIPKLADRLGIDEGIVSATRAAFQVSVDLPYERSNLIPAVTQLFRAATNDITVEMQENKQKACGKWIEALRKMGTLQ